MQLDVDPTSPLAVVRVAARHQVRGNPPNAFGFTFNDTRPTQRLQPPHMGVDDLVRIVGGITLRPKMRAMLLGQVDAVLA